MKKKGLMVLAALLVVLTALAIYASRQISATPGERALGLPGDDLIPQPLGSVNHAITIRRPPHEVWPWLAQMGSGRAGWYAYDFIDNGGQRSAEGDPVDLSNIGVGSASPHCRSYPTCSWSRSARSTRASFSRGDCPAASIRPAGRCREQLQPDQTRLIVRGRVAPGYRPYGLPQWLALPAGRVAHFIMQRKQLLGIARRAEGV